MPAPSRPWIAVLALATATFSVVTTEMLPVGLLTSLGAGLHVSPGTAGLALTLPGLVAALSAPLLPVAVRRADRRTVLCGLLLLLAAADLLSALAPHLAVLLVARALVGVCIGGVWAVAAGLGARLVPAASAGRATSLVFSGIAVASVLGVPAGTFLGALAGWRWAFAAPAGLALAVAAVLAVALPPLPAERPVRLGTFPGLLRTPQVARGLLAVALLVTGHFAAYTYVRPVLERVPDTGPALVSALLLGYGLAGIAGTFACGALSAPLGVPRYVVERLRRRRGWSLPQVLGFARTRGDPHRGGSRTSITAPRPFGALPNRSGLHPTCSAARDPRRALLAICAGLGSVVLLLVPAGRSLIASTVLLVLWGLAYGGVSVAAQNWLSAAVPQAREAASALFAGVFNSAIALGAFLGGRAADGPGLSAVLALGAGLALLAVPVLGCAKGPADRG
ncbi:MFS transporter [Streptomyces sp. GESEQ-35]|uniref:MFS transporter n=1 Tax=Streptomyces sp. GESEQ-35 TaxID=2812657 RepID=UPI001FF149EE|nr:MFS transporter [Streptomyces sp. GESEQ-35]